MDNQHLKEFIDQTLAIIVLYKMDLESSPSFFTLSSNLKKYNLKMDLVVFDNSPEPNRKAYEYENWNFHNYYDINNSGISKAYNTGFEVACKMGKKWLLLLDQDTLFEEGALFKYFQSTTQFPKTELFAPILVDDNNRIMSPCNYILTRGIYSKKIHCGLNGIKYKLVFNSGMLVSTRVYSEVGCYNEKVKLYYSDVDFIGRYQKKNKFFVVVPTFCHHQFSGFVDGDLKSTIQRFEIYLDGLFNVEMSMINRVVSSVFLVLFTLKLCIIFRNPAFIKQLIRQFFIKLDKEKQYKMFF